MSKIKTVYDKLQPSVKTELQKSARLYDSAKRLKYTLMSKVSWQDLTISQVNSLMTYSNIHGTKMSAYDFLYGDNMINE
jgi:hypothetical protein